MSSIFVRLNYGRDAGRVQEMRFDEAKQLIDAGRAERADFSGEDAQALAAEFRPAEPAPIAPPVQAATTSRRERKSLRRAIAKKLRRPN